MNGSDGAAAPAAEDQPVVDAADVGAGAGVDRSNDVVGETAVDGGAGRDPAPAAASGESVGDVADFPSVVADLSVESLLDMVETLTRERDGYLDTMRRNQAEFENARKRMLKQQVDQAEQAASHLVEDLLPVLDACDGAVQHGAVEVNPIFAALLGTLEKAGLVRLDPAGEPFDPTLHEAVMHEPAEDDDEGTVVADVLRRGYVWKGRVIRPAMVKVQG